VKCLRCGNCCTHYLVVIVDEPEKGLSEDNVICHDPDLTNHTNGVPCKHLRGDKPGEYSCFVHNHPWYNETPCFDFGQVESSPDRVCRMGEYILGKDNISNIKK
jgi:hypothetical protein